MASLDRQSQIAYRLMYMISAVLITVSFFLSTVEDLINGMLRITFASDILITDYMEIAGVGAAFFNAGCVTLITLLLMRLCKLPMHGNGISTASLMAGFSFFGKISSTCGSCCRAPFSTPASERSHCPNT